MYRYSAETFIVVRNATWIASQIPTFISPVCQKVEVFGNDRDVDFGDGRAIIKPIENGLLFWVGARDFSTYYGIRGVLHGAVYNFAPASGIVINWYDGNGEPFGSDRSRPAKERA
ncbi:hypothetical protein [Phyllobacterium zundukense]|uniref:Uncharacterized protein n=1 Tax=Phyllobacterium zundukense TaxID=1867719 RepID=A0ACD4CVV4_9HYPH|nr:hypothetical protein [Phyllobacterium zundukense]UXN57728.1 hypothetical protein N8E88_02650 [Phyllobacterium zundukense]